MTLRERSKLTVELPSDTEILMTYTFDARRHLVFDAFTRPEHLVHWWGPRGSSVSVCTMHARPGGTWRMVIRDAKGEENGFGGEVREVKPPERFVWTFGWDGLPDASVPEEMTFEEHDGRTTVTTRSVFPSKEARDMMLGSGMESGATESYERLDEHLAAIADTSDRQIVVSRIVNAPRELVWEAFTDPKHVDSWWGPRGFTTTTHSMDVRAGGEWRFDMRHDEHGDFPNRVVFVEVARPERLVFDQGSDDPADPGFRTVVTFADLGGRTEITLRQIHPTAEARDLVVRDYQAIEGGQQTLDRLAEHLATML